MGPLHKKLLHTPTYLGKINNPTPDLKPRETSVTQVVQYGVDGSSRSPQARWTEATTSQGDAIGQLKVLLDPTNGAGTLCIWSSLSQTGFQPQGNTEAISSEVTELILD